MTDKERWVDLIDDMLLDVPRDYYGSPDREWCAQFLIDHGAIFSPCKVGDTVYVVAAHGNGLIKERVNNIYTTMNCDNWILNGNAFGKTIFLTREEAEQALKES